MEFFSRIKHRSGQKQPEGTRTGQSVSPQVEYALRHRPSGQFSNRTFTRSVDENTALFSDILGINLDLSIRRFEIRTANGSTRSTLVHLEGSSSKSDLNQILHTLMVESSVCSANDGKEFVRELTARCLPFTNVSFTASAAQAAEKLMSGNSLLFVDGHAEAAILSTQAFKERSIEQPQTEQVIQGAREAFIESIGTNVSLLRKRMRSPNLRIEHLRIGRETRTTVAYCYLDGITNRQLVQEVRRRVERVDTDTLYGAGYLEQFIEDSPYSPFPQIQNTERPDKAVAAMLEGRVILLVDGTPFVLIVPATFSQFYQTTEDYDTRFLMASMIRMIRLVSLVFALVFPSVYVSLISYNPEMIPTKFAVAVAGGRAGVPFPSIAEIFGLELVMEILREATIRLPQQIGGALSIVGVLVIGEAAVQAGFVSPITVVVVALTTIGSFATPAYNAAIAFRMLRFPLMILAGLFGLYGVTIGLILITNHMIALESFGVPYLSPILPGGGAGWKDTISRSPVWRMNNRPFELQTTNPTRINTDHNTLQQKKERPLAVENLPPTEAKTQRSQKGKKPISPQKNR